MKGYILLLMVFLSACAAKKQAAEFKSQPSWMKQKPIIPGYYVGIGSAKKVGTSSEYIANARKDALADLSGEVSTQISSTSVYHTIQNKYGHVESYDQRIETTVEDYLEGFEPVEYYENNDSYWVYFRISKETYAEKKELKKQEALMTALAKYNSGIQEEKSTRPKEALTFYLQGLQAIKPYLKEETSVTYNESKMDIGNQLFSAMDQVLAALTIETEIGEIKVKRGESFGQSLKFKVRYKDMPANGIQVEFDYTGGYLKTDRQNSDGNGIVFLQPELIYSRNKQEQISAIINLKEIASKAVEDTFIRGLILKKSIQPAIVKITIESPTMAFRISENCCEGDECSRLKQVFNQNAIGGGYQFIDNNPSDFTFSLSFNVNPGTSAGGLVSVDLKGEIKLTDKSSKTIWTKEISGIRGVGGNGKESREKAFDEFKTALDRNYIKQGLDKINSGF
jgi:hypothetical protein